MRRAAIIGLFLGVLAGCALDPDAAARDAAHAQAMDIAENLELPSGYEVTEIQSFGAQTPSENRGGGQSGHVSVWFQPPERLAAADVLADFDSWFTEMGMARASGYAGGEDTCSRETVRTGWADSDKVIMLSYWIDSRQQLYIPYGYSGMVTEASRTIETTTSPRSCSDIAAPRLTDDTVRGVAKPITIRPLDNDHSPLGFDPDSFRITETIGDVDVEVVVNEWGHVEVELSAAGPVADARVGYEVCHVDGTCATAAIMVSFTEGRGEGVESRDVEFSVHVGETARLDLDVSDTDPRSGKGEVSAEVLGSPSLGSAAIREVGTRLELAYTAGPTSGVDRFEYELCIDLDALCVTGTVAVTVSS